MTSSPWFSEQRTEVFKTQFSQEISHILEPSNAQGRSLLNYLQRIAKQLNIKDFDVSELIGEATMRGLAFIDKREEAIEEPQAWLRKVCTFILYDMVKDEKKNRELKAKNIYLLEVPDSFSKIESDDQRIALDKAFKRLSKEDREILGLRFYQGKQYKDIQRLYLNKTSTLIKVPTLRKRESRALKRLREFFEEEYR